MAAAGLIEGTYTGIAGPLSNGARHLFGENSPRSKFAGVGWGLAHQDNSGAITDWISARDHRKNMSIGKDDGLYADDKFLTGAEAWGIDTKMDDGKPMRGIVETNVSGCTTTVDETDFTADFDLDSTGDACSLLFKY